MQISILQQYVEWLATASNLIDQIYQACETETDCSIICDQFVRDYSRSKLDKWQRDLAEEAREIGKPYRYDLNILVAYFRKSKILELKIGYEDFIPRIIDTQKSVQPELLFIYPELVLAVEQLQALVRPDICGDYPALERYIEEVLIPIDPQTAENANFAHFNIQRFRQKFQDTEIPEEEVIEFYMRKKDLFLKMEKVANRYGLYKKEYDPYFAQLCDVEIETLTQLIRHRQPVLSQITWKGGPAELAYLMRQLAKKGYVEAPTKGDGSINAKSFTEIIGQCFTLEDGKLSSVETELKDPTIGTSNDLYHCLSKLKSNKK